MSYFVEVILPLALNKTFTYSISETEFEFIKPGMRIAVPFGKSKIYTALALALHQNPPLLYEPKEIHQILDETPVVNEWQIKLWHWISTYYMCSIGEVYKAALPSALVLESETTITAKKEQLVDEALLSDDEFLLYEALQQQSSLKIRDVVALLNKKTVFPIIQKMIAKNVVSLEEEIHETYRPKLLRYVRLSPKYAAAASLSDLLGSIKAKKQTELLLGYFQLQAVDKKPISVKQLLAFTSVSNSVLHALVVKEVFEEYQLIQDRTDFHSTAVDATLHLSESQQNALAALKNELTLKNTCLLHGVTSSGKTEIYSQLIKDYLSQEKQVLFLLPEIALTTQLVTRLRKFFGNKVAVFHSKYSHNEKVEVWHQVLQNSHKAQVVVGARSALFLPFSNLGLVVVDEEHEQNFKQVDPAPRYHARDTVTVLANIHQAKVVLGSATPSLETYFNVQNNKYGVVELFERYNKVPMPEIVLVDLKDKYFRKRMTGHFSDTLIDEIATALALGEQIILFQNRRGYAPLMECTTCGHIPQCPNCAVSLTYHKLKNQLRCHYCGHSMAKPNQCHQCASVDLTTKGFGTEQIEMELNTLFPNHKIQRMDQDTTRGKSGYETIIAKFQNREVDILVGTQMLAKGLDFDNVSLVGILNADSMLYFPDFRAFERSFQMMTQVAGRAGRAEKKGKVIIQTYNPNHNTIQQVAHNDFMGMYNEQLYERRVFSYPPFSRLIKITLRHKEYEKVKESAFWLHQVLSQQLPLPVLGPEEPAISKIRNEYIRTILIKIPEAQSLQKTKSVILKVLHSFDTISHYRSVKRVINVDVI